MMRDRNNIKQIISVSIKLTSFSKRNVLFAIYTVLCYRNDCSYLRAFGTAVAMDMFFRRAVICMDRHLIIGEGLHWSCPTL